MNSTRERGFALLTTLFTSFNSTATPGGSKTICHRRGKGTPHEDEFAIGAGDKMGIPLEIPPLLDAMFTLSAMLGLFGYVYWLTGTDRRQMRGLDEIKRIDSDATVTPHERSAGMDGTPTIS
jgi:hypothetical protein